MILVNKVSFLRCVVYYMGFNLKRILLILAPLLIFSCFTRNELTSRKKILRVKSEKQVVADDNLSVEKDNIESYMSALVDVVSDIIMYMASYVVLVTAFVYLTVLHGVTTSESIFYYIFGIFLIIVNAFKSVNIVGVRMINFSNKCIKYHRIGAIFFCLLLWYMIFGQIITTVFSSMK